MKSSAEIAEGQPKVTKRKPKRLPMLLGPEEVGAMLGACGLSITGYRSRAILTVLAGCGLRVGEAVSLRPCDVLLDKGLIEVRQGKGAKDRVVPIHPQDIPALASWAERRPSGARWFFTTHQGGKIASRYVRELIKRIAVRSGLVRANDVHPHTLRHSAASNWLARGMTPVEVRDMLGHSNIQTTSVYLHARPQALADRLASGPAITSSAPGGSFVTKEGKQACPLPGDQPLTHPKRPNGFQTCETPKDLVQRVADLEARVEEQDASIRLLIQAVARMTE